MRFHPTTQHITKFKNYEVFTSRTFQLGFLSQLAMEPQEEKLKKRDTTVLKH